MLGRSYIPVASWTLDIMEKEKLLSFFHELKLSTGYYSNMGRPVNIRAVWFVASQVEILTLGEENPMPGRSSCARRLCQTAKQTCPLLAGAYAWQNPRLGFQTFLLYPSPAGTRQAWLTLLMWYNGLQRNVRNSAHVYLPLFCIDHVSINVNINCAV